MSDLLPNFVQEKVDELKKEKELKRTRFGKLASIFARTNSVLTGKRISVHVVDEPAIQAPAYSSTHEVWFNLNNLKDDFTARSIVSAQGLNFHELSHLFFTPRNGHALPTWVKENNYWQEFNALEDMRIENLMVAKLPSVSSWLTITIMDYLLDDEKAISLAYALTYGRKYLPTELQQLAIDNFSMPDLITELESIVDDYNDLVFDSKENVERAKELIVAFSKFLEKLPKQPQDPSGESGGRVCKFPSPFGHEKRPTQGYESSSHRPLTPSEQKKLRDKNKNNNANKGKVKRDVSKDNQAKENTNADTNSDKSKEKIENRNEKVAERTKETDFDDLEFNDEFADEYDYGNDYQQAGEKQVSNGYGTTGTNKQVTDTLNDVLDETLAEISKEINTIAKQLGISIDLVGGNEATPNRANFNQVIAPADLVLIAKAFGTELERLRSKHEPAWEYETEQGNLNVFRYQNNADFDVCFDEWQDGRADVTSIEAVILLDKSGSMSGVNADESYKSMWAIKKALEAVEARTSVVLFDYGTYLLYDNNEKAGSVIRDSGASGGTNPESAIMYAKRVLAESDKAIKILFMITDGAWDTQDGEKAINEMRNAGVLTCQAYISQYENEREHLEAYRHGFELLTQIKTAKDILTLGKELVRIAIQRNLVNH